MSEFFLNSIFNLNLNRHLFIIQIDNPITSPFTSFVFPDLDSIIYRLNKVYPECIVILGCGSIMTSGFNE
jgi:hypothetical protein